MADPINTNPGNLRIKCMIWEPQPIDVRPIQDVAMVHTAETLKMLPDYTQTQIEAFGAEPDGFILRRKYHYRHTWLMLPKTPTTAMAHIDTNKPIFGGYFTSSDNSQPCTGEVQHQMFTVIGSVFSTKVQTPIVIDGTNTTPAPAQQTSSPSLNFSSGVPSFSYFIKDTKSESIKDNATNKPTLPSGCVVNDPNIMNQSGKTIMPSQDALYVNPATVGMPNTSATQTSSGSTTQTSSGSATQTSSGSTTQTSSGSTTQTSSGSTTQTSSGSTTQTSSGSVTNMSGGSIHWLCEKQQPLFQGEDFWLEFYRQAHTFDNPPGDSGGETFYKQILDPQYSSLNPYSKVGQTAGAGTVFTNRAVLEFSQDQNGYEHIIESSRNTIDLSTQPYYLIEIGGPTEKTHRYVILLAYKDFPRFIHIGSTGLPYLDPKKGAQVATFSNVSRMLSRYDVSCKTLMEQDQLRITVRNHLGRIVVYFSGYDNHPWVIERNDLQPTNTSSGSTSNSSSGASNSSSNSSSGSNKSSGSAPSSYQNVFIPMIVPKQVMRVGGGNGKTAWCFAPLHYQNNNTFTFPNVVAIRGPAADADINLYLREKTNRDYSLFPTTTPLFYQYAEVYGEQVGDSELYTSRRKCLSPTEQQSEIAPDKDQMPSGNTSNGTPTNKANLQLAYLGVNRAATIAAASNSSSGSGNGSSGSATSNTSSTSTPPTDNSYYVRFFYTQYIMASGDYQFNASSGSNSSRRRAARASSGSNSSSPSSNVSSTTNLPFLLPSCITPISTGWRVNVPAGGGPTNPATPIDVTQHVLKVSTSHTYTDLSRCDTTGNLTFHIPNGQMPPPNGDNLTLPDQSAFIASLQNKTFYIRIYAWWEGGFMSCSGNCTANCCTCATKNPAYCALVTGLVHGGQITVQSGRRVMGCQISDYWKILEDGQFLNCPFYDGARDYNVFYDVLQQAGFHDGTTDGTFNDPWAPAALMLQLANHQLPTQWIQIFNQQTLYCSEFALPSSYDLLQSPIYKFKDNSHMDEGIMQIATVASKVAYFDQFGIFHADMRPDIAVSSGFIKSPKMTFYASPHNMPSGCAVNMLNQIITEQLQYKRAAADVFNEIQIVSNTPNGELLIGNDVNYASKFDPTSEGYLGYTKRLLQMNSVFGSAEAVENVISYYKGSYIPAILINFQAFGTSKLKPMDLIRVVGLPDDTGFRFPSQSTNPPTGAADIIVTTINHELTAGADKVSWNMNIEGEWVFTGSSDSSS
jgi:hypothetical protein